MNINDLRAKGRALSETNGSDHYRLSKLQPIELTFSLGHGDGFCLGNIIKYASRYTHTNDRRDLIKIIDYATLLLGRNHG